MTVSPWHDYPGASEIVDEAEVVVVGAGLTGTAAALALAHAGLDVALLETHRPGAGATGRTAGLLTCGPVSRFTQQTAAHGAATALGLRAQARAAIEDLSSAAAAADLELDVVTPTGAWSVYRSLPALEAARATATALRSAGYVLDEADGPDLEAEIGVPGFAGGLYDPLGATAHPVRLVEGLLAASEVRLLPDHTVRRLHLVKRGVEVLTTRGVFTTTRVVLATGGLSPELHPWLDAHVRPSGVQLLATAATGTFLRAPCYLTDDRVCALQLSDGRVLVGGLGPATTPSGGGSADALHASTQAALEDLARQTFPQLDWVGVEHRWSAPRASSPDGLPLIGRLPDAPRVFYAGARGDLGLAWAWRLGRLVAGQLLGDEVPPELAVERLLE